VGRDCPEIVNYWKKLGWVPNKLPAAFFADSVELEIADACAAREGLLQFKKLHLDYAREILARLNLLYIIQRNPYFYRKEKLNFCGSLLSG